MNWLRLSPLQFVLVLGVLVGGIALLALVDLGPALLVFLLGAIVVSLLSVSVSAFGTMQRRGSRFGLTFAIFQPLDHPWIKVADSDAETAWRDLAGSSALLFDSGWVCRTCTLRRFIVQSPDGKRCQLMVDLPDKLFAKWGAGLFIVYSHDARLEEMDVRVAAPA